MLLSCTESVNKMLCFRMCVWSISWNNQEFLTWGLVEIKVWVFVWFGVGPAASSTVASTATGPSLTARTLKGEGCWLLEMKILFPDLYHLKFILLACGTFYEGRLLHQLLCDSNYTNCFIVLDRNWNHDLHLYLVKKNAKANHARAVFLPLPISSA